MKNLGKTENKEDEIDVIDTYDSSKNSNDNIDTDEYFVSELARDDDDGLFKHIAISAAAHPLSIAFVWSALKLLVLLLLLFGITLSLFDKPEPKVKDIEFVLVDRPEAKPINKKTRFRADRNTRAGGKHDPKKKISEPKPRAAKSVAKKKVAPKRPAIKKPAPKVVQKPKQQVKPRTPAPPKPTPHRVVSKPKITPPRAFSVPVPISKAPKVVNPTSGPVTSGPITRASKAMSSPRPVMSAGSYGSPGNSRYSSGYSLGGGQAGNPGPGNPTGAPGIDAIKEPDFGPWMSELQRRIKSNWDPPKGNESKRVVLAFKVSKDGRLLELKIATSSGVRVADQAALSAVQLTAPFRPLPAEFRKPSIDIQFTFDYNVFGMGSRY